MCSPVIYDAGQKEKTRMSSGGGSLSSPGVSRYHEVSPMTPTTPPSLTAAVLRNLPSDSHPEPAIEVFAIHGAEPEVQAYAMAKNSRSELSMKESLREFSTQ